MKALLSNVPGGPETLVLTDLPEPAQPAENELLIQVKVAAVNYPDVIIIEDKYQIKPPRPFAPGSELSGIVEAVGASVKGFKRGDRVIAYTSYGAMVEKILVPADRCILMPDAMSFEDGASLILTYATSYHALKHRAKLRKGEKLLVLGAAGGIGISAVQLGKAMGATVIAAASSEEKVEQAKRQGADLGFVYPTGSIDKERAKAMTEALKKLAGPNGIDVIYDPVGGDYAEPALRSIAWEGRYLVVGFPAGIPKIPLNLLLLKGCDVLGVFWGAFASRDPEGGARTIQELVDMCAKGLIKPLVSARFPLAKGGEAISHLANRKVVGKAVVIVS